MKKITALFAVMLTLCMVFAMATTVAAEESSAAISEEVSEESSVEVSSADASSEEESSVDASSEESSEDASSEDASSEESSEDAAAVEPMTGHALEYFEAVDASCHSNGNVEYWYCAECDVFYADEACTQVTNAKRVVIAALGSENMEHYDAVEPTCHGRGNIEYWHCLDCDAYFEDEACVRLTNALSVYLGELGSENIEHVEAVEPTATENGNIEYWHCEDCDAYFADEACTQLTNALSVILPATGEAEAPTPDTGDAGLAIFAVLAVVSLAGVVVAKKVK